MTCSRALLSRLCLLGFLAFVRFAGADPAVPASVLEPKTPAEAWNVIRLSTENVDRLVREKRWVEIPVQISFCSPALGVLARASGESAASSLAQSASGWVIALATASLEKNETRVAETLRTLHGQLETLAARFDPKAVAAEIFICPMHPDFISEVATTPCAKCAMTLIPRRIPYSFVYMTPGKPTVHLSAEADGPIEGGKKVGVKVRLLNGDGTPVKSADLTVMHTQPIHLLIEEPGLGDYHHEHPIPTEIPGEYSFSFTPTQTVPYRIWADIVPVSSGLQELPYIDLPSSGKGGTIANTENRFSVSSGGMNFMLSFSGAELPHAQQTCKIQVTVSDADGQPTKRLEPLMNAFAHLVGFYDDFQTVVHLHPGGGEVVNRELRGGPSLYFTFYPPRAGFIRLYCQVMVNGENVFAPFNVNVLP